MKAKYMLSVSQVQQLLGVPGTVTRLHVEDDPHALIVHVDVSEDVVEKLIPSKQNMLHDPISQHPDVESVILPTSTLKRPL